MVLVSLIDLLVAIFFLWPRASIAGVSKSVLSVHRWVLYIAAPGSLACALVFLECEDAILHVWVFLNIVLIIQFLWLIKLFVSNLGQVMKLISHVKSFGTVLAVLSVVFILWVLCLSLVKSAELLPMYPCTIFRVF